MKKRIANEVCDKEHLADSFLAIGESYQKLREFKKALKWYTKSWESYKLIGNLEVTQYLSLHYYVLLLLYIFDIGSLCMRLVYVRQQFINYILTPEY